MIVILLLVIAVNAQHHGDAGTQPLANVDLGEISFPNSGAAEAQNSFIKGVLLLHSFEYGTSRQAFQEARRIDPNFAMAYWGEAMAWNYSIWGEQDRKAALGVLDLLGTTPEARRAKAPTDRERSYLSAVEMLYGEGDKAKRDSAYSGAMADLVRRFPDDMEARSFYALSLLGLTDTVRNTENYIKAAAVAEEVFAKNPRHPGALHYLIHAYDDPVHAPLGLRAARVYGSVARSASHAQHMPTSFSPWECGMRRMRPTKLLYRRRVRQAAEAIIPFIGWCRGTFSSGEKPTPPKCSRCSMAIWPKVPSRRLASDRPWHCAALSGW